MNKFFYIYKNKDGSMAIKDYLEIPKESESIYPHRNELVKNIVDVPEEWRKHRFLCVIYWFAHWTAVQCCAIKHFHTLFPFHDIEKPIKLLLGQSYAKVSAEHKNKPHHNPKTERNFKEAACDWQASGRTKASARLDAVATLFKYHGNDKIYVPKMLEVLLKGGFV
jgi:hypothetical protein